jgi:HAD superfamily phosphoserine phosphatase-like hydrolase
VCSEEDLPLSHEPLELVAFDVDGTLVREPEGLTVWEVLNRTFIGSAEINRERYKQFKAGRLSYSDWVALDIGGWKEAGVTRDELIADELIAAFNALELVPGTREALDSLKQLGTRLVVISGTLDLMLNTLLPDHPFDEIHANHIGFDRDGKISHWRATPFDMQGKEKLLRAIALREEIPLARCGFVGDSSNDVWIARAAGRSVAFNPRCEELERVADVVVRSDDLRDLLPHLTPS